MLLPDPDTLNNLSFNRFVLANLAAKRAEQLAKAARPLLNSEEMASLESHHPLTIALAEIALGKIKPKFVEAKPIEVEQDGATLADVIENPTVGTLLSRLSEDDFGARTLDDLIDDADLDEDIEVAADSADDEDEDKSEDEDDDIIESSDDQVSLDEVAEQENQDENESSDD
jgi:DNA-directed RNA polymerase subunit omega